MVSVVQLFWDLLLSISSKPAELCNVSDRTRFGCPGSAVGSDTHNVQHIWGLGSPILRTTLSDFLRTSRSHRHSNTPRQIPATCQTAPRSRPRAIPRHLFRIWGHGPTPSSSTNRWTTSVKHTRPSWCASMLIHGRKSCSSALSASVYLA
jgi:hypothetical protein